MLYRLLLRGTKKVLYVARTPTQLGLQPLTVHPALVPPGSLASAATTGRGSIPQSSGTSPALPGAGTDGISLRMRCSGGRGSFWARRQTERWCCLGYKGRGRCRTLGCLQMQALSLLQKVSSLPPPVATGKSGQSMLHWLKATS